MIAPEGDGEQRILVELDALLDTRIATIARLDPGIAADIVGPRYFNRPTDQFHLLDNRIDDVAYQMAYASRDLDTMAIARPTAALDWLGKMVRDLEKQFEEGAPTVTSLAVDVNVYPYRLSDEEAAQVGMSIAYYIGKFTSVNVINVPLAELSFAYIRAHRYTAVILYNFKEWIEASFKQYGDKQPMGVPAVTMFVPSLMADYTEYMDEKNRRLPDGRLLDPYEVTRETFAPFIGLEFTPSGLFSLPNVTGESDERPE